MNPVSSVSFVREVGDSEAFVEDSSFVRALSGETELLEEVVVLLRRQRQAIADEDLQVLDDSTLAIHRTLFRVAQARGVSSNLSPARLRDQEQRSWDALRETARTVEQEVKVNQRLLRDALQSGDERARAIRGEGFSSETKPGSFLINRTV